MFINGGRHWLQIIIVIVEISNFFCILVAIGVGCIGMRAAENIII